MLGQPCSISCLYDADSRDDVTDYGNKKFKAKIVCDRTCCTQLLTMHMHAERFDSDRAWFLIKAAASQTHNLLRKLI